MEDIYSKLAQTKLPRRIEKPWGHELIFAHTPMYAGKLIFIRKGHQLSLQYHQQKDESIYVHQGKALLEVYPEQSQRADEPDAKPTQSIVQLGDCFRFKPMTRHCLKALEDTTLFEVSTPELEDVVRLEDDYGRID